jgi:hypothetical protein
MSKGPQKPRTFMCQAAGGRRTLEAEQVATFAHYIQGAQFRFVVTKLPGEVVGSVTHRHSGNRVCAIPVVSLQAALGDVKLAAVSELKKLIERAGEARVASVLRAAEA